jgi:type I restriction enzyme, R subunit
MATQQKGCSLSPPNPEAEAREAIDKLLTEAGWSVMDSNEANIHASQGVAIREFPLKSGHGFADYLLYVDGQAAGVIEAKKEGVTLTGVETQAGTLPGTAEMAGRKFSKWLQS